MRRLILASGSLFRLQLLRDAGFTVAAMSTGFAEPDPATLKPLETGLIHIAQGKALAALEQGGTGLIFAADTVGRVAGQVCGKPRDRAEARRMLEAISGTTHEVLTGWCLLRSRDRLLLGGVERTVIQMRRWTDEELHVYLESGDWIGKSGAYGLQQPVDPFVTGLEGSAANVVGVPLERLQTLLREFPALEEETRITGNETPPPV
ncbi:MAG: Maf family protein [Planctomycetales bacterium]